MVNIVKYNCIVYIKVAKRGGVLGGGLFVLGLHPRHMEIPRVGVQSELDLPATATPDPRHVCNLHHSSQQGWILIPLGGAKD